MLFPQHHSIFLSKLSVLWAYTCYVAIKSRSDWRQWILGQWEICLTCSTHFVFTWVAPRLIANRAADRVVTEVLYPTQLMCMYPNTSWLKTLYLVHYRGDIMGFHRGCEVCLLSLGEAGQNRGAQMKRNKSYFLLADMLSRIQCVFPVRLSHISG